MDTTSTHGGKRKKSGRKPITDKKQTVTIYIRSSVIEKAGGMDNLKELIYSQFNALQQQ